MTLAAMESAALNFANELRALQGAAPVERLSKGSAYDTGGCPIAKTATVDGSGVKWSVGPFTSAFKVGRELTTYRRETPAEAREFMAAFDAGEFPALTETTEGVAV